MRHLYLRVRWILACLVLLAAIAPVSLAQESRPLLPLDDPLAPFLESRAYAAKMGATAEFRKMEWVAIDPVNNKLYVAMS